MTRPQHCDELHCLLLGWEFCAESLSLEDGSDTDILRLPIIAILARTPAGWFLLETGCDARPYRSGTPDDIYVHGAPQFEHAGDPLLEAMAARGVSIDDLVGAAVSHLHLDHSGGLRHLARRVPVVVHERELAFALDRAGRPEGYVRDDYDLPGLDWRTVDREQEIAPGIDAIPTPGHTPGHMSYRVRMRESGTWIFAVDAIDLQRGIDEDRAVGSSADPADAPLRRGSHERLVHLAAREGARLVPGHCPVTWPPLAQRVEGFR